MKEGKDYRYVYKSDENPVERLRNKLSGIYTLLDLLSKTEQTPIMAALIEKTKESLPDIRMLLDDAEKCEC